MTLKKYAVQYTTPDGRNLTTTVHAKEDKYISIEFFKTYSKQCLINSHYEIVKKSEEPFYLRGKV